MKARFIRGRGGREPRPGLRRGRCAGAAILARRVRRWTPDLLGSGREAHRIVNGINQHRSLPVTAVSPFVERSPRSHWFHTLNSKSAHALITMAAASNSTL